MNYEYVYNQLIENRISNPLHDDVYGEFHHIKPRSLFPELVNDPRNIIKLTAREHFVAHELLERIYPTRKMRQALRLLASLANKNGGRLSRYYRVGSKSRIRYVQNNTISIKTPLCTLKLLAQAAKADGMETSAFALRMIQQGLARMVADGRLAI